MNNAVSVENIVLRAGLDMHLSRGTYNIDYTLLKGYEKFTAAANAHEMVLGFDRPVLRVEPEFDPNDWPDEVNRNLKLKRGMIEVSRVLNGGKFEQYSWFMYKLRDPDEVAKEIASLPGGSELYDSLFEIFFPIYQEDVKLNPVIRPGQTADARHK